MIPLLRCSCTVGTLWLLLICWAGPCLANGIPPSPLYHALYRDLSFILPVAIGIFCTTVVAEYAVVYFLVGWHDDAGVELFRWTLFVNLMTNPALQYILFSMRGPSLTTICIAEFVVVVVEFGLWMWIFGRMYHSGLLARRPTALRTLLISLVANVASIAAAWVCLPVMFFLVRRIGVF